MSTTQPRSALIVTCETCKQPWSTHETSAKRRAQAEFDELLDMGNHDSGQSIPPVPAVISYLDCVRALQDANRGPVGYTGAMGATGLSDK